jgi:hypothetical protein
MDDDIDAAELLGHRVGDRRTALTGGDIRSHKWLLRGHIKDKKGRLFLVVAEEARLIDLRTLHAKIGARGRLGFAPSDIVREVLGVEPGALTPLALIHDRSHATTVVLDAKIMNDTQLNFHPVPTGNQIRTY